MCEGRFGRYQKVRNVNIFCMFMCEPTLCYSMKHYEKFIYQKWSYTKIRFTNL